MDDKVKVRGWYEWNRKNYEKKNKKKKKDVVCER